MTVPAVTSVAPNNGSLAGGQAITITGTALDSATAVYFGANLATITTNSATQIVATSPAGTVGTVDVTVTTSGGTSPTVTADHFTYAAGVSVDPLWRSAVSYTQGYGYQTTDGTVQYDQRRSSAVLGVIVRGAPDTLSAYSGATNMGYLPSYYPTDTGLMAYRITARTFGAGNILLQPTTARSSWMASSPARATSVCRGGRIPPVLYCQPRPMAMRACGRSTSPSRLSASDIVCIVPTRRPTTAASTTRLIQAR